jgi:restriction system protein
VRSLQTTKAHATDPMDSPLALTDSMAAILLMIAIFLSATAIEPALLTQPPAAIQPAAQAIPTPMPRLAATSPPHDQAVTYASDSQNDAQLREWKKRNAESMKILEKTTQEMPLR